MNNTPVIVEKTIDAPVATIWAALTDKNKMKEWYFDLDQFKAEPGFEFQFYGEGKEGEKYLHLCTVQEVIENKKLSYTWRYDGFEGISLVTFELSPEGDQTKVKLTHTGLETFATDNPDFAKNSFEQGWTDIIGKMLPEYLEKVKQ
jgi:uncharacterized protein YndB with AHSA1/START domain